MEEEEEEEGAERVLSCCCITSKIEGRSSSGPESVRLSDRQQRKLLIPPGTRINKEARFHFASQGFPKYFPREGRWNFHSRGVLGTTPPTFSISWLSFSQGKSLPSLSFFLFAYGDFSYPTLLFLFFESRESREEQEEEGAATACHCRS